MEGPTPISALIHAATMATACVFMVARMSPLYELSTTALSVVLVIGAITAFFTGLIGLVQNDIKRVVAYSTLSQLGYMMVALGASAYAVGIFHLTTMPSSRRCCSSAPVRSSLPCITNRTCARWAACATRCPLPS